MINISKQTHIQTKHNISNKHKLCITPPKQTTINTTNVTQNNKFIDIRFRHAKNQKQNTQFKTQQQQQTNIYKQITDNKNNNKHIQTNNKNNNISNKTLTITHRNNTDACVSYFFLLCLDINDI